MPYFSETITKANYYILRRWQQRLCRIRGECARATKKLLYLLHIFWMLICQLFYGHTDIIFKMNGMWLIF